jgi:hypothetical protein
MDEQAALHEAIEKLYTTFAKYPLRHPVQGCPCCVSESDQKRLASKELRPLDGTDLARFAWKAMTTWGDENDFKHFLPRVLELLSDARELKNLPDLYVIFGKLNYCKEWSEQEREAITNYLLTLWRWILASRHPGDKCYWSASQYLEEIFDWIDDLAPFLNIWRDLHTPSLLRHFSDMIRYHSWESRLIQNKQVWAWMWEESTKEKLEEGFYAYMDEDWAEELSLAVDVLDMWRVVFLQPNASEEQKLSH